MSTRFQVHPDCAEIVIDTQTGLLWQRGFGKPRNYIAAQTYAANLRFGGFTDWRLPTPEELKSLVDYTRIAPAICIDAFPFTPPDRPDGFDEDDDQNFRYYWTNTMTAFDSACAWVVDFEFGNYNHHAMRFENHTRAVRGYTQTDTQTDTQNRFEIQPHTQGDVVIDHQTGLMWQRDGSETPYVYEDACACAALVEAGGFTDWRLPSDEELISLIDHICHNPAIDIHTFPKTKTDLSYWTHTELGNHTDTVWVVNFKNGDDAHAAKVGKYFREECYVRAVRKV